MLLTLARQYSWRDQRPSSAVVKGWSDGLPKEWSKELPRDEAKSVTVDEFSYSFSPFTVMDCTLFSHFSFQDFVALAFPDLAKDLDAQI